MFKGINTLRSLNCVAMEHHTSLEKALEMPYQQAKGGVDNG